MKVYDYGLFFEDGHKEFFCLKYGPEGTERYLDSLDNEWFDRFDQDTPGAKEVLCQLDETHGFAFCIVNSPRETE